MLRSSIWPLAIICASSIPLNSIRAKRKSMLRDVRRVCPERSEPMNCQDHRPLNYADLGSPNFELFSVRWPVATQEAAGGWLFPTHTCRSSRQDLASRSGVAGHSPADVPGMSSSFAYVRQLPPWASSSLLFRRLTLHDFSTATSGFTVSECYSWSTPLAAPLADRSAVVHSCIRRSGPWNAGSVRSFSIHLDLINRIRGVRTSAAQQSPRFRQA